ncbi:MAG TPA: arylesterase [Candidatus Competibacteraceae bacterium]|nr:arylesterase [Candidatus Competibacteraceae bacterium]
MRLGAVLNRLRLAALLLTLTAPLAAAEPVILVLGDSLSSGYGIELAHSWVNLLQQRLQTQGYPHRVVNASISGDTSTGGRSRLPAALAQHRPDIVILELGGNDGLRGLPLEVVKSNLAAMIESAHQAGAQVLLAEMRIPPNYGPRYTEKFQALYGELARQYDVPLIPFLLDGVAAQPGMMQEDGIHPTAAAQMRIVDNVWKVLEPLLENRDSYSSTTNRTRGLTAHSSS